MKYVLSDQAKKLKSEYQREWRKKNRDHINQYQREWFAKNPDKSKLYHWRYWERKAVQSFTILN